MNLALLLCVLVLALVARGELCPGYDDNYDLSIRSAAVPAQLPIAQWQRFEYRSWCEEKCNRRCDCKAFVYHAEVLDTGRGVRALCQIFATRSVKFKPGKINVTYGLRNTACPGLSRFYTDAVYGDRHTPVKIAFFKAANVTRQQCEMLCNARCNCRAYNLRPTGWTSNKGDRLGLCALYTGPMAGRPPPKPRLFTNDPIVPANYMERAPCSGLDGDCGNSEDPGPYCCQPGQTCSSLSSCTGGTHCFLMYCQHKEQLWWAQNGID